MEITKKKEIPQDLYEIIQDIKFRKYKIILLGTASLESQRYFSDYDLFTLINKKINAYSAYKTFSQIFENVNTNPDNYFTEFKIQQKDGTKFKYFNSAELTQKKFVEQFVNVDFCKGDFVVRLDNKFIELSVIYSFNEVPPVENLIESLKKDIVEYTKEGKYYKVLKRIFAMNKLQNNNEVLVELSELFNSEVGKLYQKNSNLKALELILEHYDDPDTVNKAKQNLFDLGLGHNLDILKEVSAKYEKIINREGHKLLKKFM